MQIWGIDFDAIKITVMFIVFLLIFGALQETIIKRAILYFFYLKKVFSNEKGENKECLEKNKK